MGEVARPGVRRVKPLGPQSDEQRVDSSSSSSSSNNSKHHYQHRRLKTHKGTKPILKLTLLSQAVKMVTWHRPPFPLEIKVKMLLNLL